MAINTGLHEYPVSRDVTTNTGKSQTPAQILVDLWDGAMPRPSSAFTYSKARAMRLHPSIALGREFAIAPIVGAGWTVEGDDAQVEWLTDELLHHRTELLRNCLLGEIDFGWKAFEIIYRVLPDFGLDKFKPLKNDQTFARREVATGDFLGLRTTDLYTGLYIYIDADHSFFMSCDEEGLGGYGESRLARIESVYDDWVIAAGAASKFDNKMAGGIWQLSYVPMKVDVGGVETDAQDVAATVLKAIRGAGSVATPNVPQAIGDKAVNSFQIEHIGPNGVQADYVPRLKYLDAMMFRGLSIPERVLSEGTFGTKAESEAQASIALLNLQLKHEAITEYINRYVVQTLLITKFGKADAKLVAGPLSDEKQAFYEKFLTTMAADRAVGPEVFARTDLDTLFDMTGIPVLEDAPDQTYVDPLQAAVAKQDALAPPEPTTPAQPGYPAPKAKK